jgi:hypothetical protein
MRRSRDRGVFARRSWVGSLARFLTQDYYPLTPQPADLEAWSRWQFHDREDNAGFVQFFSPKVPTEAHNFALPGLDSAATYRFIDPYSGVPLKSRKRGLRLVSV